MERREREIFPPRRNREWKVMESGPRNGIFKQKIQVARIFIPKRFAHPKNHGISGHWCFGDPNKDHPKKMFPLWILDFGSAPIDHFPSLTTRIQTSSQSGLQDHCDHPDYWKCEGNFVAYHPFKATRTITEFLDVGFLSRKGKGFFGHFKNDEILWNQVFQRFFGTTC